MAGLLGRHRQHRRKAGRRAGQGRRYGRFKGAADTAKGTPRYWDVQVSPIFGSDGKPSHLLSISRDITEEWRTTAELKEASARQELLTGELAHRIKNTLAMVGAIANQTMRGSDVAAAREAFAARLMTLSKAHDILTQTSWTGAPIGQVVSGALAPHRTGDRRIHFGGPEIELGPKPALALSLAVHELATNAAKYGALSTSGKVDIVWSNDEGGSTPGFRFTWTESGGPTVSEPTAKGFGTRLIEKMLASDFAGEAKTFYRPDGIVCELVAPMVRPAANSAWMLRTTDECPAKRELVLIVEDDALLRMDAMQMIEEAGFDVLEAANADAAIAFSKPARTSMSFLPTSICPTDR